MKNAIYNSHGSIPDEERFSQAITSSPFLTSQSTNVSALSYATLAFCQKHLRFVQLTPPGSACSIVIGVGITDMPPGSQKGLQMVVADANAVRDELVKRGVAVSEIEVMPWGSFVYFSDPDGIRWSLQQLPSRT